MAVQNNEISLTELKTGTDSLMRDYRFDDALALFRKAAAGADSLDAIVIDELMVQAQNGKNMAGFCSTPVPVAKQRFSLKDFYLFYPLQDGSWRPVPNQIDNGDGKGFVKATYWPDDADVLYWSAADSEGIRNVYRSSFRDTVWTAPELLNEQMTSSSDEIFPMISPDGKQLFFASKGLYGMGGYDLYVSEWDDNLNDWGIPVNMGFPYSSPYDDFLFINTDDGKYSMFASNRDCPADSVDIYVLEYDSMPVRKAVDSPEELRELCRIEPEKEMSNIYSGKPGEDVGDNEEMRQYSRMLVEVRALRDSIYAFSKSIDEARGRLSEVSGDEKAVLAAEIMSREAMLPKLQDSLSRETRALQKLELGFLQSGVVIDPERLQKEAEREVVGSKSGYTFSRKKPGKLITIDMLQPEPEFDYTFQILPEGRFALDNTLPDGLVYQIQLFAISSKATLKQIKGLSPVFERTGSTGKHIYSVGVFRSYKDVLSNLNKVKRLGFRSAIIVAFMDGKSVNVTKARNIEKSIHELFQIRVFPADGASLKESEISLIKSATDADMARTMEDGMVSYIIGPFDSRDKASSVAGAMKESGITNLRIESAGMSEAKE
ncbi:MAG: TolB family protein [Candidatus Cryptobacteroides sp.]